MNLFLYRNVNPTMLLKNKPIFEGKLQRAVTVNDFQLTKGSRGLEAHQMHDGVYDHVGHYGKIEGCIVEIPDEYMNILRGFMQAEYYTIYVTVKDSDDIKKASIFLFPFKADQDRIVPFIEGGRRLTPEDKTDDFSSETNFIYKP